MYFLRYTHGNTIKYYTYLYEKEIIDEKKHQRKIKVLIPGMTNSTRSSNSYDKK